MNLKVKKQDSLHIKPKLNVDTEITRGTITITSANNTYDSCYTFVNPARGRLPYHALEINQKNMMHRAIWIDRS